MTDNNFGFICELEVFQSAAHDYLVSKLSGIGKPTEATSRFQTCQRERYDIVCPQDIHTQSQQECYIKAEVEAY